MRFLPFLFSKNNKNSEKTANQAGTDRRSEAEHRRLAAVLDALSEAVLMTDENLVLTLANRKARKFFGIAEDFNSVSVISLLEATRSTELEALAEQVLDKNAPVKRELKCYPAGTQLCLKVSAAPLNLPDGERRGLAIIMTDITRLRKLEVVRKDFAANVSHELRTPIQLVKGFAETLLDSPLEDKDQIRYFIGIILKNARTMENLTADLLSLVSLEQGNSSFDMRETLVYPLLREAVASVESAAEKKNTKVFLSCAPEMKAVLYGPLIIQGAINLLDNAVKYSPPDSAVWIEAETRPQSGSSAPELVIAVRDQGIGIPANHLGRIFERFYRVDRSRSREQGGTGLGLAIVRHIALLHNGTAEAESHAGEGSIFRIRIPLANAGTSSL
jgi:two-component system phosphate regulon sensor histidine kinase PhoR